MADIASLSTFQTFGALLHYLRRQAWLTQRELAIAAGYSESMISQMEHDKRPPDVATIQALFVPALHLEKQPEVVARLIELAQAARDERGEKALPREPAAAGARRPFAAQHRLPVRLTSFVGRTDDVRAVAKLMSQSRLVTLTGPGGCGKTSLAVETARRLAGSDATGVADFATIALVELFPLDDPHMITQAVLAALGVEVNQEEAALSTLLNFISERPTLLVLDNCEHLIDDAARFVLVLLQHCPNLRVLATSRERLNIAAESVYPVQPLACPHLRPLPDLAEIADSPAVRLFVERS